MLPATVSRSKKQIQRSNASAVAKKTKQRATNHNHDKTSTSRLRHVANKKMASTTRASKLVNLGLEFDGFKDFVHQGSCTLQ